MQLDANTQRMRKVYVPIFQLNGFSQERKFSLRGQPQNNLVKVDRISTF